MKKYAKRFLIPMLAVLLILQTVPALAAPEDSKNVTVSDAEGSAGDTVKLTVALSDAATANTIGIQFSYDKNVLEFSDAGKWLLSDGMSDVDVSANRAVWTTETAGEISGAVFEAVFQVKKDAPAGASDVTYSVIVKNGGTQVVSESAKTTVKVMEEKSEPESETESESASNPPKMGDISHFTWFLVMAAGIGVSAVAFCKKKHVF